MVDEQQPGGDRPAEPGPPGPGRTTLRWSVAAVTFVVGLVVGGVIVGVVAGRPTSVPADAGGSTATAAPPQGAGGPTASPSPAATAQVMVNDACLRAINAAQDVYQQLGDLADAAQHLDAARLDEVVRQLQPLESRLRNTIPDCKVTTRLPNGLVISGTPAPADSSAASSPGG